MSPQRQHGRINEQIALAGNCLQEFNASSVLKISDKT